MRFDVRACACVSARDVRIVGDSADCLRLLLEAGADKNEANDRGETPLHIMAERDSPNCLRLLLEAGADVSARNKFGQTPLHSMVWLDTPECRRLLLEKGVDAMDVSARNTFGLRLLLEAGADACARNKFGRTPLEQAEHWNCEVAAAVLRQHAAPGSP